MSKSKIEQIKTNVCATLAAAVLLLGLPGTLILDNHVFNSMDSGAQAEMAFAIEHSAILK